MSINYTYSQNQSTEEISLGTGCFWCSEAIFQRLKGIISVEPGYMGGHTYSPTYQEVCTGETGHAEVIHLVFNTDSINLEEILRVFFMTHDPTTLNRQGADVGTQYRSVVFYTTENQKRIVEKIRDELNLKQIWEKPIVTEIAAASKFYPAEDYHHNYYNNNPNQGYCRFVIVPKIEKFEKVFADQIKK